MKVKVVSKQFMIRISIEQIIHECFKDIEKEVELIENLEEIVESEKVDYIFFHITNLNIDELERIENLRTSNPEIKVLVIDLENNEKLLLKAMEFDIEAYISNILNKEDFIYIVSSIKKGKTYYESELVRNILLKSIKSNNPDKLTKREKEILEKIGHGFTNKEISNELYITEYTVKKHISSIFNKLKVRSRSEAILYLQKNSSYI